jgi:hypothetical protein
VRLILDGTVVRVRLHPLRRYNFRLVLAWLRQLLLLILIATLTRNQRQRNGHRRRRCTDVMSSRLGHKAIPGLGRVEKPIDAGIVN